MSVRILAAAAVLVTCSLAPAQAQQASSKAGDYRNKKICRVEGAVGSRLVKNRTCRTKAEWDELDRDQRTITERIQAYSPPCLLLSNQPGNNGPTCSS
jgi:hypothetical protein